MDYQTFLASKRLIVQSSGHTVKADDVHPLLFPFQRDIVTWALRKGRAAIFADTGLGKTLMQLEWARLTGQRTLILAPLAVARQTIRESAKLDIPLVYARTQEQAAPDGLTITNYEMLEHFDPSQFGAVVLDESSILKNLTGKTRNALVKAFSKTPYRLCCTATPAPNDITELANHAAFLGVMSPQQMTSIFFVHEAGVFEGTKTSRWRLKRHAVEKFYEWLTSWGIAVKKPSDLGYYDDGYLLPPLAIQMHNVHSEYVPDGQLFMAGGISATEARKVRKATLEERVALTAQMVNVSTEQWILWAGLNDEAYALACAIPDAINVEGSMSPERKADLLMEFVSGQRRVLISKTSIAGFGMNMQQCHNMAFVGLDYSWESYYQAIRRIYRFGQANPVNIHVVISDQEMTIWESVQRKEVEAVEMSNSLIKSSRKYAMDELQNKAADWSYKTGDARGLDWHLMLGDSAERMAEIPDNSIHLSVYSPPFSDMYIYNNSERDLSNSKDLNEFFAHYDFIIRENLRITMPGRICCVHVQDPKTFGNREGYRGLRDFSGATIDAYVKAGWIYRSCITIDKNPQIVATRNKDTDLLFVTGKRDSADLAPMATDYILVFKKPGDNPVPITPYLHKEMSEQDWITWAHAVWYGIRETDVLNVAVARGNDDEKHMCPLQLPVIDRCLKLWSNPGELIFSAFAGIGSEGYQALKTKRRFIGIELKPEYHKVACDNLRNAERLGDDLFAYAAREGIALEESAD